MKPIILGTAGHIDHGKTVLVKALTGTDTDRLPEEKARGITIDLGFAQMDLGDGVRAGVVDVPGHERFVKNMLAGAGGVDLVMLVVAADEGVMPQTREHLAICRLLGVKEGLVVLTKKDLVEPEWLSLVEEDVADLVRETFLEGKPVLSVSAKTGEGLGELRETLSALARTVVPKSDAGLFRLPVDRVFTMRGFGAVVTGTLFSGQVKVGERACIYPALRGARVRGLQVHGAATEGAWAGMRTAVNLQGVEKADVARGDVLGHPATLKPTFMLDVSLEHLEDAPHPLKSRARVRFHAGTCEVMARAVLIGRDALEPGDSGYAQLRLEAPVALLPRDRFVLRSYSPMVTIGGGEVLDVLPRKHRPFRPEVRERFNRLDGADDRTRLLLHLEEAGASGLATEELVGRLPLGAAAVRALVEELAGGRRRPSREPALESPPPQPGLEGSGHPRSGPVAGGALVVVDRESGRALGREAFDALADNVLASLTDYHRANPLRPGMPREELRGRLGGPVAIPERAFGAVLDHLTRAGQVAVEEGNVRLASHQVQVDPRLGELKEKLEAEFRLARFQPPSPEEVFEKLGMRTARERELLQVLVDERALVRVKENVVYHRSALGEARALLEGYLREHREIAASQFRDLLGITRKHAIPLLEYFDAQRVTLRVGDNRVLRNP
ncbi:MAG: selenocysteine-specific translation elongation factor [Nitrospinota bacterium]